MAKVQTRKEKAEQLALQFSYIKGVSKSIQRIGRNITEMGTQGEKTANYLAQEIPKIEKASRKFPIYQNYLDYLDNWLDQELQETKLAIDTLGKEEKILVKGNYYATSSVLSTNTTATSLAALTVIAQDSCPQINLEKEYSIKKPDKLLTKPNYELLDNLLKEVDQNLVQKRKGAWDAFHSDSLDKLSQAANSLREILRYLISKFASNKDVIKSKWWEPDKRTKSGVSLYHRFRYLLYGPNWTPLNKEEQSRMKLEIQNYTRKYELLNKVSHGSLRSSENAVELALYAIEHFIHQLLYKRKNNLYKKA